MARLVLLLLAATGILWIRTLPLSLAGVPVPNRAQFTFLGDDGREHVYLGDLDGCTTSECDANTDCDDSNVCTTDECRGTATQGSCALGEPNLR